MMDFIPLSGKGSKGKNQFQYEREIKRRSDPVIQPSRRKKARNSYVDHQLSHRLKDCLENGSHKKVLSVDDLVSQLQKNYPEYRRKKLITLKSTVENALLYLEEQEGLEIPKEIPSTDSNEEKEPDSNWGNNSMINLYHKNSSNLTTDANNLDCGPGKSNSLTNKDTQMRAKNHLLPKGKVNNESKIEGPISKEQKKLKKRKEINFQKSTVTFADVGGIEETLEEICKLLLHLKHPEIYQQLGVIPPRGFLLHGPPGCGKTLMAHAIAGELELPFIKIAATEIVSGVSGESEEKIREIFDSAVSNAPCLLFIDEIDAITPKRETAQKEMERRIVAQLLMCMDDLNQKDATTQVLVIGATNRPDSLDPALRRAGRFDREISLGIPNEAARSRIIQVLCRNFKLKPDFNYMNLAHHTPGYVGADLMALTREAATCAINRVFSAVVPKVSDENGCVKDTSVHLSWLKDQPPLTESQLNDLYIENDDFELALKLVQPSAKREGFATVPNTTWSDIGALQDIREELQLAILVPVNHRDKFEELGLSSSAGILLCGPPGCGKTLLAKAVANESGINFISVKGPELLNMYVGESERAVRQCFQRARNSSPCVIFFDELDALCPRRTDSAESGPSARVVNQLLTEMDGLESRKQVFVLAATNRPDIIDPAMLRPGRLDKMLFIGLPCPDDRIDILKTITKNGTKPVLKDVDLVALGRDPRCDGYTGADLAALVREASMMALKDFISDSSSQENKSMVVETRHFEVAFSKVKRSVTLKEQKIYDAMKGKLSLSS